VLADGRVLKTGSRAKKSSSGYDLTRLMVGSEGTLGIITELTLKLAGIPETVLAAICPFATIEGACNATIAAMQMGLPLARIELLDDVQIRACNAYSHLSLAEQPTLFLEFHGTPASVREQAESVQSIAHQHGGEDFEWSTRPEDRSRLWNARHHAYFACLQLKPGARAFTTDACVPISRLAECIGATLDDIRSSTLPSPLFGHVGDGNFHCVILANPNDAAEMAEAERLNRRVMRRALAMDGTCTGEHGIGLHKIDLLEEELGPDAVDLMRRLKRAWDPLNILNPRKIVGDLAA